MSNKRLLIPIARFEANRALAQDVFLHLPLNQRTIRLAEANSSLDADLLERIRKKGHAHLEVSTEDQNANPATFPIYAGETANAEELLATSAASNGDGSILTKVKAGEEEAEAENHFAADASTTESEEKFSADPGDFGSLIAGKSKEEVSIAEDGARGSPLTENFDENDFGADPSAASQPQMASEGAARESDESRFGKEEAELSEEILTADGEQTDSKRLEGDNSSEVLFKVKSNEDDEAESVIFRLEQKLELAKETILSGGKFDLEREKDSILKDAKNSILASKISDRIIELKKQPEEHAATHEEISELTLSLQKAETGADLSQDTLGRFPVSKEMKEVETIISAERPQAEKIVDLSEHLSNYAKSRDEAKALISGETEEEADEFGPLKKSSSHRDLPTTASRFAAYLGHSLGYTHPTFLNDLAISSLYHFAKRAGGDFEDSALPPLGKLLENGNEDEPNEVCDARDVLLFLELYLEDPECDRTEKEFTQKIFTRIANNALKDQKICAWNIKCWTSFIEAGGPSLEAYSVCNRAAASAQKFARTYTKN